MIIEKLRENTALIHRELDEWLTPVFRKIDNTDSYSILLKSFYGFYEPVMKIIIEKIDSRYLPDLHNRRMPELILNDIAAINKPLNPIPFASRLPAINNASHAFGALYVIEGSTLGGVYLSKILAEKMQLSPQKGLSFFYGYGKKSRERWNEFIDSINLFAAEKGEEKDIISAANDTFTLLKKHLQETLF